MSRLPLAAPRRLIPLGPYPVLRQTETDTEKPLAFAGACLYVPPLADAGPTDRQRADDESG